VLPFSAEQFFAIFREYNEAVWPAQWLLTMLASAAVWLAVRPNRWSSAAIAAILGLLWLWIGLAYHLAFFATINPLAYAFSAVSTAGALVFVWCGLVRRTLHFRIGLHARGVLGISLVALALVGYPAWSLFEGHRYPAFPTFGLPCPTTLFTIGMLAFLERPYSRLPLVVPVLWSLVGTQAAFLLGVHQDAVLLLAAGAGVVLWVRSRGPALRTAAP
jgi:hypothetical protein